MFQVIIGTLVFDEKDDGGPGEVAYSISGGSLTWRHAGLFDTLKEATAFARLLLAGTSTNTVHIREV